MIITVYDDLISCAGCVFLGFLGLSDKRLSCHVAQSSSETRELNMLFEESKENIFIYESNNTKRGMTSFLRNLFNLRPPATQLELQRQQKLLQVANEQLLIENETLESLEKTMLAFQRKKRDLKDKEQFLIESRRRHVLSYNFTYFFLPCINHVVCNYVCCSLLIELQESSDADAAKNEAFLRDEFPKTLDSLRKKLILFDRQIGDLEVWWWLNI